MHVGIWEVNEFWFKGSQIVAKMRRWSETHFSVLAPMLSRNFLYISVGFPHTDFTAQNG